MDTLDKRFIANGSLFRTADFNGYNHVLATKINAYEFYRPDARKDNEIFTAYFYVFFRYVSGRSYALLVYQQRLLRRSANFRK